MQNIAICNSKTFAKINHSSMFFVLSFYFLIIFNVNSYKPESTDNLSTPCVLLFLKIGVRLRHISRSFYIYFLQLQEEELLRWQDAQKKSANTQWKGEENCQWCRRTRKLCIWHWLNSTIKPPVRYKENILCMHVKNKHYVSCRCEAIQNKHHAIKLTLSG